MTSVEPVPPEPVAPGEPLHPEFLLGGGAMGQRMRTLDWRATPLGPPARWPQALRTVVQLMLTTNHPMFVFWGADHLCLYNDGYSRSLGPEKHPAMLGAPGKAMWAEIWPTIGPQIEQVMAGGAATWHEDHLVPILRNGRLDDVWWTYSFSPVENEGGVGGVLVLCTETTLRVRANAAQQAEILRLTDLFRQSPGFVAILRGPDHQFAFVNEAYREMFVGDGDVIGRIVTDAFPEAVAQGFVAMLDTVLRTGQTQFGQGMRFEVNVQPDGLKETFLDFIYQPIRDATGTVSGIFVDGYDVTDRIRAARAQEANETRRRFLDLLQSETEAVGDPLAIMTTMARLVGRHLDADICAFADMDPDAGTIDILGDWSKGGTPSIAGRYDLDCFGEQAGQTLRDGLPLVLCDTETDLTPEDAEVFRHLGLRATLCLPLVKDGRPTALMAVHSATPRDWTDDDTTLIREAIARTSAQVERVRAEAALRASEARFRGAVAAMQGVLWTNDAAGRMVGPQAGWAALTGQTFEAYQGYGWSDAVHRNDALPTVEAWNAAVASASTFEFEHRIRRADGEWRLCSVRAQPLKDEAGRVVEWVGVHTDITDRRAAEQALRASEAQFRNLADAMPQLVWTADADGEMTYFSNRRQQYWGGEGSDPTNWAMTFHPDDAPNSQAVWQKSVRTGVPFVCEHRVRLADGRWVWHLCRAEATKDAEGRVLNWYGSATEIEQMIAAREVLAKSRAELEAEVLDRTTALREREARLRTVFETTHLLQMYLEPDGKVIDANPASLAVIAMDIAFVAGRPVWATPWFDGTPQIAARIEAAIADAARGHRLDDRVVLDVGGETRSFDLSLRPVTSDGRIGAIVLEAVETTARLAAEEALRQAQKMEAVGQLTGGIAHDFNNLLTVIASGMRLLERDLDAETSKRVRDGMQQAVSRGSGLTRQLLAFSRRRPLEARVVDPAGQLRGMSQLLERSLQEDIAVAMDLPDGLWPVHVDPGEFELAILNLCVNARDAMPGGGTITIEGRNVGGGTDGIAEHEVQITVRDTGAGIDPATLKRVFEPFFTTKEVGKGSGLGLAQVYAFAQQSRGSVAIDSQQGVGTSVRLTLPRTEQRPDAQAPLETSGATDRAALRPKVLLVEDDAEVATMARITLASLGYPLHHVSSAQQALHALDQDPSIGLVFSDVMMPGQMNGIDLARRVRALKPGLPIVLTTGVMDKAEAARSDGFTLLPKPYDRDALARALDGTESS